MIIANWKSNGGLMMIQDWTSDFINSCSPKDFYVGIAPPVIYISDFSSLEWYLDTLEEKSNNKIWDIKIGAQDVDHSSGSRTGAIAIKMFEDFGIDFAIIGHSERREYFNEDNDLIRQKISALNGSNVKTKILCIGETKEENDKGITKDVLKNQIEVVDAMNLENFIIAYEPVWAIGSGLTPDPKDINEIHKYIKDVVQSTSANNLVPKVMYGGSVTDKNAESFFTEQFVDGALVGGASLNGKTFANIVNIYSSTK